MKSNKTNVSSILRLCILVSIVILSACDKTDDVAVIPDSALASTEVAGKNGSNSPLFMQRDQMGRPGINTVFVPSARKDEFNVTIPSEMGDAFSLTFQNTLASFGYVTNILGLDAASFAGVLATDVLNVDLNAPTAFGTLNGRTLADDVIDTELTLIFGGADGLGNPGLTSDGVDGNDKAFLPYFPYLASPH